MPTRGCDWSGRICQLGRLAVATLDLETRRKIDNGHVVDIADFDVIVITRRDIFLDIPFVFASVAFGVR
jgi:hypothetical protein